MDYESQILQLEADRSALYVQFKVIEAKLKSLNNLREVYKACEDESLELDKVVAELNKSKNKNLPK